LCFAGVLFLANTYLPKYDDGDDDDDCFSMTEVMYGLFCKVK